MNAAWKIGRLAGITVRMHATFPLLLAWIAAAQYAERERWSDVGLGLAYTAAIFGTVVLHELGHALTARKFGIRTRDITLLPIGGIARLERIPERPRQELWIALAGPAVNVALAVACFALLALRGDPLGFDARWLAESYLGRFAWLNVGIAGFNLLPAFPMDGGRVLRAGLALRLDYARATRLAVVVGKSFAVLLGLLGLVANPFLVLLAVFVWLGAEQEGGATQLKAALAGVTVGDVMMTEFHTLAPDDSLQRAVDFALAARQQHFPVVDDGGLVGVLCWADLLAGLTAAGATARVGARMRRHPRVIRADETVKHALGRFPDGDFRVMPVVENGKVVGLFTPENLVESVRLRDAMEHAPTATPTPRARERANLPRAAAEQILRGNCQDTRSGSGTRE